MLWRRKFCMIMHTAAAPWALFALGPRAITAKAARPSTQPDLVGPSSSSSDPPAPALISCQKGHLGGRAALDVALGRQGRTKPKPINTCVCDMGGVSMTCRPGSLGIAGNSGSSVAWLRCAAQARRQPDIAAVPVAADLAP